MLLKDRYKKVLEYFSREMPVAETELHYEDPFGLLVAVILSAQCTDKRVNMITPQLLKAFPDAQALSEARQEEVYELIRTCSYPNSKAKNLIGMAKMLVARFGGQVPENPEDLRLLPGVGRKTANVVASVLYNKPVIAVDTHVFRVSRRIGLAGNARTPLEVERRLEQNIPPGLRHKAHHWLILHGRYVCKALNPGCNECGLKTVCSYYNRKESRKNIRKTTS